MALKSAIVFSILATSFPTSSCDRESDRIAKFSEVLFKLSNVWLNLS